MVKLNDIRSRTKHIDIEGHFVWEQIRSGKVTLKYLPATIMVADILTNGLPRFYQFIANLSSTLKTLDLVRVATICFHIINLFHFFEQHSHLTQIKSPASL